MGDAADDAYRRAEIEREESPMPANPFDFEDPERFAPVEFPEPPDIVYILGVRLEREGEGWTCPHGVWRPDTEAENLIASRCLTFCNLPVNEQPYEPWDPKHATFHERYAEQADLDRKRAKGE